jgi:enamine deaminase RidA (YjgF/YER057c/UK114 family)
MEVGRSLFPIRIWRTNRVEMMVRRRWFLALFPVTAPVIIGSLVMVGTASAALAEETFDPAQRLAELGIELPAPGAPVANYVRTVRTGNLVFTSGHGPRAADGSLVTGKLGRDLTLEQGYSAARATAVALLASLQAEIGDLSKVQRVVKVTGMVNSDPEFTDQPKVINGCSDLLVEVFGERGRHARAAVGMASLPMGMAVEIEMIVEIE